MYRIILVNPHLVYFRQIKYCLRNSKDKTYTKVFSNYLNVPYQKITSKYYDFLIQIPNSTRQIEFLIDKKQISFTNKKLKILAKLFNLGLIEFLVWRKRNGISSKTKFYTSLDRADPCKNVVIVLARDVSEFEISSFKKWAKRGGKIYVHMTHYFKNTPNIKKLLKIKSGITLISQGQIIENSFFRNNFSGTFKHLTLAHTVDHLDFYQPLKNKIRKANCLIVGSHTKHSNEYLKKMYDSDYLHLDRVDFALRAENYPELFWMDDRRSFQSIREMYSNFLMFFTGIESIGLPSVNVVEGMYFGSMLIAPRNFAYLELGMTPGVHYADYELGNWRNFYEVCSYYQKNNHEASKIARAGESFVKKNFTMSNVFSVLHQDIEYKLQTMNLLYDKGFNLKNRPKKNLKNLKIK
jgi:hypothetical protein